MKKTKLFLALLALMLFTRAIAQTGEIIYRDFEPDLVLHVGVPPRDTIWVDFDNDNTPDIYVYWWFSSPSVGVQIVSCNQLVKICRTEEDDIIPHLEEWESCEFYPHLRETYAIRIEKEDGFYYGWFRTYINYEPYEVNDFCFDKFAYCTIPNYPLRWGQTSFTNVEENDVANAFVAVCPNPTAGIVRIDGDKAAEVHVYNALGQLVKTVQNANEINLHSLPSGVYLLRVTLEDGTVFSDKVVKE